MGQRDADLSTKSRSNYGGKINQKTMTCNYLNLRYTNIHAHVVVMDDLEYLHKAKST